MERYYLKAAGVDAELEKMVKYLAVLALSDHEQLSYWPSTVAAGLVILASLESRGDSSYLKVIEVEILLEQASFNTNENSVSNQQLSKWLAWCSITVST